MQTVEPGLDATVWYGGADLKFVNSTSAAIKIECNIEDGFLTTTLTGDKQSLHPTIISRRELGATNNQVAVEVFQQDGKATKLVSRDLYTISSHRTTQHLANRLSRSTVASSDRAVAKDHAAFGSAGSVSLLNSDSVTVR
jgi:vancomycin resistance protein YoaR